jgi:hypothetical protein
MRYRFHGDKVGIRDARRRSRIKPFRDETQTDPSYLFSLPPTGDGKRYYGRDQQDPAGVQLYLGGAQEGPDDELVGEPLAEGSYYSVSSEDGNIHIHCGGDEDEALPMNTGSKPIEHMGNALAQLNNANDRFWKYADGGGARVPDNIAAAASAVRAVMMDGGVTRDSSMIGQKGLAGLNQMHRRHYSEHGHTHGTQMPKGVPMTSAAETAKGAIGAEGPSVGYQGGPWGDRRR